METNTTYPPSGFQPDRPLTDRQAAWARRNSIIRTNTTNGGK